MCISMMYTLSSRRSSDLGLSRPRGFAGEKGDVFADFRNPGREPVGDFDFWRRDAGQLFQQFKGLFHGPVSILVSQNVTLTKATIFRRENMSDRDITNMNPV